MEQLGNTSRRYPVWFSAICSLSSITVRVLLYIYVYVCMYVCMNIFLHTYIHTLHAFYSKCYGTYGTPKEKPYAVMV